MGGSSHVDADVALMLILEDFGAFLQTVPGAFVFIGNGSTGTPGGVPLHNNSYDFNDAILPISARYFTEVIKRRLFEKSS